MYLHSLKYTLLGIIREKALVFWCFAFPILLGIMFHFAFGGLIEGERFSPIPTAIVFQEENDALRELLHTLEEPGKNRFLYTVYTDEEKALALLKKKKVDGILYAGSFPA